MKIFLGIYLVFLLYLFLLPSLVFSLIPCLNNTSPQPYDACTLSIIADKYVIFMVIGLLVGTLSVYILAKATSQKIVSVLFVIILMGVSGVLSYYRFLPLALQKLGQVEVYLDPVL